MTAADSGQPRQPDPLGEAVALDLDADSGQRPSIPDLIAEVERLRDQLQGERLIHALQEQRLREVHGKAPRLEDDPTAHMLGLVTPDRCRECGETNPVVADLRRQLAEEKARVARVRALCDDWAASAYGSPRHLAAKVRAALDAPEETP